MARPGSQNAPAHHPSPRVDRLRRALLSLLAGLVLVTAAMVAVDALPETALGRSIDAHLTRFADPRSWIP
jgi:hypothetical protein